jgi:hypothetical protein
MINFTNFILILFSLLFILFVFSIFTFVCCGACFGYLIFSKVREFIGLRKSSLSSLSSSSSYQGVSVEPSAPLDYTEDEAEAVYVEAYLCPPLVSNQQHNINNNIENASVLVGGDNKKYNPDLPSNSDLETNSSPSKGYRDVIFAILFVINIVIILYFALSSNENDSNINIEDNKDKLIIYSSIFSSIILGVITIGTILTFLGTVWLSMLLKYSDILIEAIIKINIASSIIISIIFLFSGNFIYSLLLAFVAFLNYFYFQSVRDRIPFASAVIKTSSECISQYYNHLILTAYFLLFMQCCWLLLWAKASFNISMNNSNDNSSNNNSNNDDINNYNSNGVLYFMLILSLCWGFQVFQACM